MASEKENMTMATEPRMEPNDGPLVHPILLDCLADEAGVKYDLTSCFVLDGFRYATDGRICVRERTTGEPNTPGKWPRPVEWWFGGDHGPPEVIGDATYIHDMRAYCVRAGLELVNARLAVIPRQHGVTEWRPPRLHNGPIYFAGDGFEGAVMPMFTNAHEAPPLEDREAVRS